MIRFERVERIGEGRENFSEKSFTSLPKPHFPKTFDFIESLFAAFSGLRSREGLFRMTPV